MVLKKSLLVIVTLITLCLDSIHGTDPVYSPLTLTDAVGNTADSDATITWAALPSGSPLGAASPERVDPHLAPYLSMVNGFIGVVFANGIPKDAIRNAATDDLGIGDATNNYQDFLGFVICVAIGLLFMPIFMIVVCCMCFCRCCCGRCGGKREPPKKEEAKNLCRKYAVVIVLGIVITLLVLGFYILWATKSDLFDIIVSQAEQLDDNFDDLTDSLIIYAKDSTGQYPFTLVLVGIAMALGIMLTLLFIMLVCCFGCCQCCGKREQQEKDANNICRKSSFGIAMLVVSVFLVSGAGIMFALNDDVSDAIDTIQPTVDNNVHDMKVYVNNTVDKINHIVTTNFQFMMDTVNRDLENDTIAFLVGIPLRTEVENQTNIRTTLTNAHSLDTDLDNADTALTDVETKKTDLQTSLTALDTALTDFKTNVTNAFTACGATCPDPKPNTNINLAVDSTQFPDITGARTSMNSAVGSNLTAKLVDAEQEVDSIPDTVAEKSYSNRNSIQNTTSDLSDDLDDIRDEIQDLQDKISGNDSSLDDFSESVESMINTIKPYDQYRWYANIGLSVMILVVTACALVGMALGVLGTYNPVHPTKRSRVPHCGGCLLVVFSVMSSILLLLFLMFLTMPFFVIGSPLQAFVCKPLTDLTYMKELWDVYNDAKVGSGNSYLGDAIHGNQSIQMSPSGILEDCENGRSAWNTFHFDQQFDLEDLLNYSKTLDVQAEIDAVNIDLSSVDVYPTSLQTQLTDAADAINVNFTAFYLELGNDPTDMNLSSIADELDQYVITHSIPDPANAELVMAANNLRDIETNEYADVVTKIAALNTSVASMETAVAPISPKISDLQAGLQTADDFIQNNGSDAVRPHLNVYATRLIGIVESFKDFTMDAITNKMGDCTPVWNMYNSFIVYTFCYNFIDLFNGSWFATGWCVFFFFIGFIFSMKLSKYFLRMTDDNKVGPTPQQEKLPNKLPEKPPIGALDDVHVAPEISNRKFHASQFSRKRSHIHPGVSSSQGRSGEW